MQLLKCCFIVMVYILLFVPCLPIASNCEEFFCYSSHECLPWFKICDGRQDCENLSDEGGLCSRSCAGDNGGCSQICNKSPHGSKCSCFKGYK